MVGSYMGGASMKRRDFIKAGLAVAVAPKVTPVLGAGASTAGLKPITIAKTDCGFEREPMIRPFGFKGGYLTEEWIVSAYVRSASGKHGIGLGTQNCLWTLQNPITRCRHTREAQCSCETCRFIMGRFVLVMGRLPFGHGAFSFRHGAF